MKKKLKPVDPATYARFRREKRCFEPAHQECIDKLASQLEERIKFVAALEEALSNLKVEMAGMVKKELAEEMAQTARLSGIHHGEQEAEERLRKEKSCFDVFHKFTEGKRVMNLGLVQIMNLFVELAKRPLSEGVYDKITVLVPLSYEARGGASRLELNKAVDSAIEAVFKNRPFIR